MATVRAGEFAVEYNDIGHGEPVILIHCSCSTAAQWRQLADMLARRYRVLALNLFGYGATSPWPGDRPQTLDDHVALIAAVAEIAGGRVHLVGHSLGGAMALHMGLRLGDRVVSLGLIEANPFFLLRQQGRREAFDEVRSLRQAMLDHLSRGEDEAAAERFIDYWSTAGTWAAMHDGRRRAIMATLAHNVFEWEALFDEPTALAAYGALDIDTLIVRAADTTRPIREIADMLHHTVPGAGLAEIAAGGHMCPLSRPDLVNPVIAAHLDRAAAARKRDG